MSSQKLKLEKNANEKIAQKYKDILNITEPYILGYPENFEKFNMSPFGHEIPVSNRLSCVDANNAKFYDLLQTLDKLSFGPVGMPMDKWVFFDCGEMVGGIYGLALRAKNAKKIVLEQYGVDETYEGLIPVSMYIAIPMASNKSWFGHNLCSANSFLGSEYTFAGLALLTKAFGVKALNFTRSLGATQWDSKALNIHLQLSDMELKSAYTPAHSFEYTITYQADYHDDVLLNALAGNTRDAIKGTYDKLVDPTDFEYIKDLQKRIQNGERFKLVGRPQNVDGKGFLPIKKI